MRMLRSRGSLAERMGRAGRRQLDAGLLRQPHDLLRAAVQHVEADEVAALGHDPRARRRCRRDAVRTRRRPSRTSARRSRGGDPSAPAVRRCRAGAHVAQLVDLVAADRALAHPPEVPGDVLGRRREQRHAGAGQRDLRGRAEDEGAVADGRGARRPRRCWGSRSARRSGDARRRRCPRTGGSPARPSASPRAARSSLPNRPRRSGCCTSARTTCP